MPRFVSHDGIELAYEQEGNGPTVVLLHGFASDAYTNWIRPGIFGALADAGYRAVALDLRGHGSSDKPHEPAAYAGSSIPRDVQVLLDELGVERCHAVGYSMGAWITLRLAGSDERIVSAVCGGIGERMLERPVGRGEAFAEALTTPDPSRITDRVARSFRDFADLTGADRRALAALQRADERGLPNLDAVQVPVLVVCGDQDPLAGGPDGVAERLSHGRALVVGGTHLNVINNPEFRDAILGFLSEIGTST